MAALPSKLPSLTTREAITDAIYRTVLGLDNPDPELFESAFTTDAKFDLNGRVTDGLATIKSDCYGLISKLDTTHFITNIRISVTDDESKATVNTSALAQHYRQGQGNVQDAARLLTGSLYFFDLVKDGQAGLWKIKDWKLKLIWTEGDWGVISST